MNVTYLDNAASSWPKPASVIEAMRESVEEYGANPGRGAHQLAMAASRTIFETRKNLAKLFGIVNPNDLFFYGNTSVALNQAIKGLLKHGDHVITTMLEHNSVRRPLEFLNRNRGVEITYVKASQQGVIDIEDIRRAIKKNTKFIVTTHASNLLGTIVPIKQIGKIAKEAGIIYLVDAAQTAGVVPIDVNEMNVDMLAFPGHKGLYGPQGTGGLYVHPSINLIPLVHGGTGSQSEEIDQPSTRPDRYESGTPNTPGIAGLNAGVKFILETGMEELHRKEMELTQSLLEGLDELSGVQRYGLPTIEGRVGVVAFNIEGWDASEIALILDQHYQIAVRSGFHCTPLGHDTAGTVLTGAIRASVSYFNRQEDIDKLLGAVKEISLAKG